MVVVTAEAGRGESMERKSLTPPSLPSVAGELRDLTGTVCYITSERVSTPPLGTEHRIGTEQPWTAAAGAEGEPTSQRLLCNK